MAGSRLPKFGTIFTRVSGLLRSGVMKETDKPLWYDVYAAFPPKYEPNYFRPPIEKHIPEILYPEDVIRAKFYKKFGSPGLINMNDVHGRSKPLSERFLEKYQELAKEGSHPEEELFEATVNSLKAQGIYLDRKPSETAKHEASEKKTDATDSSSSS